MRRIAVLLPMINIIVGTAGHIDHGKTALVRALTGIETDRLAEEKRRGISIDLGFAWLDLAPGLRAGLVDVPGHERFVKNMLAGAGGIDIVLFVIAADESIKPQTREHFEICRLLGISAGIVVVTKADLAGPDLVELVKLEASEFVAGSFLENAPIMAVSAKTGEGVAELKDALASLARHVRLKSAQGYLRLPVDRAFSVKGFGTVVTGTLISGALHVDQEVEAVERGLRFRVRGIQVHGQSVTKALAGQRTAVNVAGVDAADLGRGVTVGEPGRFEPVSTIDCEFDLLASAKPLKHRAPIHFHAGTAETIAEVRLLDRAAPVEPGSRALVRIHLREPLLLLPGDRFIVRMFSPVVTIGGGRVIDIAQPRPGGAAPRLSRKAAAERARSLAGADAAERIAILVDSSARGISVKDLIGRTGYQEGEIEAIAQKGPFVYLPHPAQWVAGKGWVEGRARRIHEVTAAFHRANPLLPGIPKEQVRSQELGDAPEFLFEAILQRSKTVVAEGDILRLTTHRLHLKQDEETALARIEEAFAKAGLTVPALAEVLAASGVDPARARTLLQLLLRQGRLVRASEDLVFHPSAIRQLKQLLAAHKGEQFAVPVFKDWTGISRKYAIPLLEYLDRERVTRREGDVRVVL
ncbi:MAG: selenocysteine-specific translation elongation factor [Bryobacteraceae bacterium]